MTEEKETGYEINLVVQLEDDGDWDLLAHAVHPWREQQVASGTDMNGERDMQFHIDTAEEAPMFIARVRHALDDAGLSSQIVKLELVDKERLWVDTLETALIIDVPEHRGQVLVRIPGRHFKQEEIQIDFRPDPGAVWTPSAFFPNNVTVRWHGGDL